MAQSSFLFLSNSSPTNRLNSRLISIDKKSFLSSNTNNSSDKNHNQTGNVKTQDDSIRSFNFANRFDSKEQRQFAISSKIILRKQLQVIFFFW